jgi:hypothetical protein
VLFAILMAIGLAVSAVSAKSPARSNLATPAVFQPILLRQAHRPTLPSRCALGPGGINIAVVLSSLLARAVRPQRRPMRFDSGIGAGNPRAADGCQGEGACDRGHAKSWPGCRSACRGRRQGDGSSERRSLRFTPRLTDAAYAASIERTSGPVRGCRGSGALSPAPSDLPPGNNRRCPEWGGIWHPQLRRTKANWHSANGTSASPGKRRIGPSWTPDRA